MERARLSPDETPRPRCFYEDDPQTSLVRRSLAEGLGTMMLMIVVLGSGLQAGNSPLSSSIAVASCLIGLILAFGAVSGGHFNPTITLIQWRAGKRRLDCTVAYVAAQIGGGLAGSLISAALFSATPGWPTWEVPRISSLASEGVASFALMAVVFCCARSTPKLLGPFAVGLWLMGAITSTPTGSIANPAVAISLLVAPHGGSLLALPLFIAIQVAGGSLAAWAVSVIYPDRASIPA